MPLDSQHKRIRKNRVSITYDVETYGSIEARELPFIIGVMGNFSGMLPADQQIPLHERQFIQIDQDNFDTVMARLKPQISITVENTLSNDPENETLSCDLSFRKMKDFEPDELAKQIPDIKEMIDARNQLLVLLSKADRSRDLERELKDVLKNSDLMAKLSTELGIES